METHQRTKLLKLVSEKKLSVSTQIRISRIIKHSRVSQGHEQAERVAKDIREILKATTTEEELLGYLKKYPMM